MSQRGRVKAGPPKGRRKKRRRRKGPTRAPSRKSFIARQPKGFASSKMIEQRNTALKGQKKKGKHHLAPRHLGSGARKKKIFNGKKNKFVFQPFGPDLK